jgi:hypothetical protein
VVRQLVAEATWQAVRRSPTVRAYFERMRRGDSQRKKIALVATAHYLALDVPHFRSETAARPDYGPGEARHQGRRPSDPQPVADIRRD